MNIKFLKILAALSICALLFSSCSQKNTDTKVADKNENAKENTENQADGETNAADAVTFENSDFGDAFAKILGKETKEITKSDCESVKYLALGKDSDGSFSLYAGFDDYSKAYFAELEKETPDPSGLVQYVSIQTIDASQDAVFDKDLSLFTGIEIFEIYDVKISDVSFVNSYGNLYYGYFSNNGITDVSPLSDYDPETLRELDFTGNDISDWEPLMHISNKVIVKYSSQTFTDSDGNPVTFSDTTYLSDLGKDGENTDSSDNSSSDENQIQFSDDIDWSALFDE